MDAGFIPIFVENINETDKDDNNDNDDEDDTLISRVIIIKIRNIPIWLFLMNNIIESLVISISRISLVQIKLNPRLFPLLEK